MKSILHILAATVSFMINRLWMKSKSILVILTIGLGIGIPCMSYAQPLAGSDDLNRVLPQNDSVGDPVVGKTVAMFYFLWQGHSASPSSNYYYDLSKIVPAHPSVLNNYTDPYWGSSTPAYYFWGEPIYNYYKGDDYWVHLKNVQLLTDAGVDILVLDATNAIDYGPEANALMNALDAVRIQGKTPPKIVFYTNTSSGATMQNIYNDFYKAGSPYSHPNSWYYLNGKPLIIGISSDATGKDYQNFFTYRESQWPNEAQKINGWPWIEFVRPQRVYTNDQGQREIVNVSVAQHPNPTAGMGGSAFYGYIGNWGRSYHNGSIGNPSVDLPYGYNIQEQWDFAISQNTPFIFVTGWNEWIAGRWASSDGNPQHSLFVDAASPEFSRDIEPSLTGSLKDNYYMQLISNIRRYKGIEASTPLSASTTITGMSDWAAVSPSYSDYVGDTQVRNHAGAQSSVLTNLVTINNFGFESPVIASSPGFVQAPAGGSWLFSGTCGIVTNGGAYGNPTSIEGVQACYLQQVGYFEQSLSFGVDGTYQLSFSAAQRPGNTQVFNVYCDAALIATITPGSTSYKSYFYSFTTTAGNHTIKFVGTSTGDNTAFIDNVNIGIVSTVTYTNTTGRNDFDKMKVARDATNLYFYAKTVAAITPNSGNNWMCLYLDLDRNVATGWHGYDYKVTGGSVLQKWVSGAWANINTIPYTVSGTEMYITIPRSYIGNIPDPLNLEFKWSDNMQDTNNPLDWYVNGDAAPGGRLNFIATTNILPKTTVPCAITNTGFESPVLANGTFQYNPTPNGWVFSALSGVAQNGSAFGNPVTPEGVQCGFIQKNYTIYQDVNLNAGTYKVALLAAQRPGNSLTMNVYCDSTLIGVITPSSSTSFDLYTTNNFTVAAGTHRIQFAGTTSADQTAFIDNVEIVLQTNLANNGFESPAVTGFQYTPTSNGWVFSALSGVAHNGSAFGNPNAPEGVQCGFIQKNYTIYQDFNFTAGTYKINLAAAQRPGNSQTINVYCDGTQIGTVSPASSASFTYFTTNSFYVASGTHRIQFTGVDTTDQTAFIDNINLIPGDCVSGGPLPVEFLDINVHKYHNGINIDWSTSQEFNSSRFDVEKSTEENNNRWNLVSSINAAGNSSTLKNYNVFDPNPFNGVNLFRIKQVDKDGNFKYSNVVSLKWIIDKSSVSVLNNPFHNSISVKFSGMASQVVYARLVDITGKQLASEKWQLITGITKKEFSNVNNLQKGMYILSISNVDGVVIYSNKVLKL